MIFFKKTRERWGRLRENALDAKRLVSSLHDRVKHNHNRELATLEQIKEEMRSMRGSLYDLNHNSEIKTCDYPELLKEVDDRVTYTYTYGSIDINDIRRHAPKMYAKLRDHFYEEMKENLKKGEIK